MESAAELHEARVLRAGIEMREAELAALPGDDSSGRTRAARRGDRECLKGDYRRVLARQADEDYSPPPRRVARAAGRPSRVLPPLRRERLRLTGYFFEISKLILIVLATL